MEFTGLTTIMKQLAWYNDGMALWRLGYSDRCIGDHILWGWSKVFQKVAYTLNQHSVCGAVSPITRIHESRNQGLEMEMALLTITPSDTAAKFCFLLPWLYADLKILVPKGGMVPPGDTMIPLN